MNTGRLYFLIKGGNGSGNFRHSGRHGKVGGSLSEAVQKKTGETQGFKWRFGQREGLFDLPDIPVTYVSGNELGNSVTDIRISANAKLAEIKGVKNNDTGWALFFSRNDRSKMAKDPERTLQELQTIAGIESLAKYAVLAETHDDQKYQNEDVQAIHRMYAPVSIGGKFYRVKLTVRDYIGVRSGTKTRLHAIETVEIEKAPFGTIPTGKEITLNGTIQRTTGHKLSIPVAAKKEKRSGRSTPAYTTNKMVTKQELLTEHHVMSVSELLRNSTRNDGLAWDLSGELKKAISPGIFLLIVGKARKKE